MEESDGPSEYDFFYKFWKSKDILHDLGKKDTHYPFTKSLVKIAETKEIPEEQRKEGMLGIVSEMETFCKLYEEKLYPVFRENIKKLTACARKDISEASYYFALSDIESIESNYLFKLQKELSQIMVPEVKNLLLKRMLESGLRMYGIETYIVLEE